MFVPSLGTIISSLQLARALPASSVVSSVSVFPQADLVNDLGNKGYLVFGLILFIWELLPTTLLVGFFRVHRPPQDLVGPPPQRLLVQYRGSGPWEFWSGVLGQLWH